MNNRATLNVLIHRVNKDTNSPQPSLQCIFLSQESTVDAYKTDASFIVRSTIASVAKAVSAASHRSQKFLPIARIVRTEVCANNMGSAHISSPSEK